MLFRTLIVAVMALLVLANVACKKQSLSAIKPRIAVDYFRHMEGEHKMKGIVVDNWSGRGDTTYETDENWHISVLNDSTLLVVMGGGERGEFELNGYDSVLHNYEFSYNARSMYSRHLLYYSYEKDSIVYSYWQTHYEFPIYVKKDMHSYK